MSDDNRAEPILAHVGGYRVLRRLATGGTSDVLLARAEGPHGFGRKVVLKRLLSAYATDPSFERMFAREASAYARLSHPAIVKLYDFFSVDGRLVQVLEHVDGLPLNRLRASLRGIGHVLDDRAAIYGASRIFAALAAAHSARDIDSGEFAPVIHRDVNPSNVLIPWDGYVKLSDFGVAKVAGLPSDTQAGLIKGTFGYMAPEQVRGEDVTVRADVYAGALVLWELLARRKAIQRGALPEIEILRAMAEPSIVSLDLLRPDVHESVRNAVRRALEPKPDRRAITADEMLAVLRAAVPPDEGRESLIAAMALVRPSPVLDAMTPTEGKPSAADTVPDPPPGRRSEREALNAMPFAKAFVALASSGALRPRSAPPPGPAERASRLPPTLQTEPQPPPSSALPSTRTESSRPWTLRYGGTSSPQPPSPPRVPVAPGASPPAAVNGVVNGASKTSVAPTLVSSAPPPPPPLPADPLVVPAPLDGPFFSLASLARTVPLPVVPAVPLADPLPLQPSAAPRTPPPRAPPVPAVAAPPAPAPHAKISPSPLPPTPSPAAPAVAPAQIPRAPMNPFLGMPTPHSPLVAGPALFAAPERPSRKISKAVLVAPLVLIAISGLVGGVWSQSRRSNTAGGVTVGPAASLLSGEPSLRSSAPPPSASPVGSASPSLSATSLSTVPSGRPPALSEPSAPSSVASSPPVPPSAIETGTLSTAGARKGHRIFVDGKVLGQTPDVLRVACGAHKVKIGSAGVEQRVDVPCGGEISLNK